MKKIIHHITLCLVMLFSLISCEMDRAMKLDKKIVEISDSLNKKAQRWQNEMLKEQPNLQQMIEYRKDIQEYMQGKIAEIQQLPQVEEAETYKQKAIEYFQHRESLINETLQEFEQMTQENSHTIKQRYNEIVEQGHLLYEEMAQAQQEFAQKKDIKIK